jgi:hypothetical protein
LRFSHHRKRGVLVNLEGLEGVGDKEDVHAGIVGRALLRSAPDAHRSSGFARTITHKASIGRAQWVEHLNPLIEPPLLIELVKT